MTVNVELKLDTQKLKKELRERVKRAQLRLDAQVLADSNYFIPHDTGALEESGIIHTVVGSGYVIWRTPYARTQYYCDFDHSKQRNPNATMKWYETAKARYAKNWRKLVDDTLKRN